MFDIKPAYRSLEPINFFGQRLNRVVNLLFGMLIGHEEPESRRLFGDRWVQNRLHIDPALE